jgi:predicted type IV restriction endonuclease
MAIPKKISDRIHTALKRLDPIIQQQRAKDISEADTVVLVTEIMVEVLGYDKFSELTGEFCIRGTYCDLAVRLDEKVCEVVEVKAIGIALNDRHLKQAVDYAANQGIEWVILTNAVAWQLHRVFFTKPIAHRIVASLDITAIDCRKEEDLELLYAFTKEGLKRGVPSELGDRQEATSRFLIAAILLNNESVSNVLRRELRRVVDVNVTEGEITKVLESEVIKREALEGPDAAEAAARVKRAGHRPLRAESEGPESPAPEAEIAAAAKSDEAGVEAS